jgi:hypothetical protein
LRGGQMNLIFFNSDEPEPFSDYFYHFQEIYPEKKERKDQRLSVPVINVRFHCADDKHLFLIHIDEKDEYLDVSQYCCDELLEFMALEEYLQELISKGKIPSNAMFRIY